MSIELLRDVVILISVLVLMGVLIFIAVLFFMLFQRIKSILDSMKAVAKTLKDITSYVDDEMVKPVIKAVTILRSIQQGINAASKIFGKKKGGGHE